MKKTGLLLPLILIISCGSGAKPAAPVEPAPPAPVEAAQPAPTPPLASPPPVETVQPPPTPPPQVVQSSPPEQEDFDPASITEEKYTNAKTEVQTLIADLNKIIRAKNYNAWVNYLAESYLKEISSPDFLEEKTEELYKRDQIVASNLGRDPRRVQKKILRTPRDYFDNVVVPSRSNDHMDDIAFVSLNRVKAYTMDNRGQRLVLYDLEIIDDKWKIIN